MIVKYRVRKVRRHKAIVAGQESFAWKSVSSACCYVVKSDVRSQPIEIIFVISTSKLETRTVNPSKRNQNFKLD